MNGIRANFRHDTKSGNANILSSMVVLLRNKITVATLFIFFLVFGYYTWTPDQERSTTSYASPPSTGLRYLQPRHLRVIVPTSKELLDQTEDGGLNLMLCKSLLSSISLGYPTPVLTNFNVSYHDNTQIAGGSHLGKFEGTRRYLNSLSTEYDDDIIFVYDGTDTWMQLPPETLITRYLRLIEGSVARLESMYGAKARVKGGMESRVFFSVQKTCGLNYEQSFSPGCLAAPVSTLPLDFLGRMTDLAPADPNDVSSPHMRPRYINSGFVIGPVKAMRAVYDRASYLSQHGYSNIGSDQYIMQEMMGQQEIWRRLQAEKYPAMWSPKTFTTAVPPMRAAGASLDNSSSSSKHDMDWHDLYDFDPDVTYELGMDMDETSGMSQVTWSYEKELEYVVHGNKAETRSAISERNISTSAAMTLPEDVQALPPPLSHVKKAGDGAATSDKATSWNKAPLVTNFWTGQTAALVHMNMMWKDRIPADWSRTWFFVHLRSLLDAAALGGTAPVATVAVPGAGAGVQQEWYARTLRGGLLETDRAGTEGPRYTSLEAVCGTQWARLLGDGKGKWVNPAM